MRRVLGLRRDDERGTDVGRQRHVQRLVFAALLRRLQPHVHSTRSPTSTPRASNLLFGCVSAATVLKNAFVLVQVNRFQQIIGVYTLQAPSYSNKVRLLKPTQCIGYFMAFFLFCSRFFCFFLLLGIRFTVMLNLKAYNSTTVLTRPIRSL